MSKKPSLLSNRLHRDSEVQTSSAFERPHLVDKLFETGVVQVTKDSEKVAEVSANNNVSVDIDKNNSSYVSNNVSTDVSTNIDRNNSNDVSNNDDRNNSNDVSNNVDRNNSNDVFKDIDRNNDVSKDIGGNISNDVSNDVDRNNSNDENNDVNVLNKVPDNRIIIVSKKKDNSDRLKRVSYYLKPSTDKLIAYNAKLAGLGKSEFLQNLLDKAFEKLEIQD